MIERNISLTEARAARSVREAKGLNALDPHGEPEGEIYDPKDFLGISASLAILVKDIGDWLEKNYDGWAWGITADQNGGIIDIVSGRLHPNYGMRIHIEDLQDDPSRRQLKRLAGQMLERFGMPRKPFFMCIPEYQAARRNSMGHVIPDLSDKPNDKLMMREKLEQNRWDPRWGNQQAAQHGGR